MRTFIYITLHGDAYFVFISRIHIQLYNDNALDFKREHFIKYPLVLTCFLNVLATYQTDSLDVGQ